ncbi:MAG: hypothetical protein SO096_03470 [Prevotella sp.]|nr:hypothetical protein [Bacteroidales bacterium]MCI6119136.1 hypothetical protein [Prevotella sp.]MCI7653145.1 hypothetical protein [Bacteroidales bacterium]MDY4601823.1 hypothetical protein [Bacteroides uniformis]MDY4955505.1 hypothetical protein [Prevotella sp.]
MITKGQLNKQLLETVLGKDNKFISEEEKQDIAAKFKELDVKAEELSYEDWNYILSAIKDRNTRNITIMIAKQM